MKIFRMSDTVGLQNLDNKVTLGIVIPTLGDRMEYLHQLFMSFDAFKISIEVVVVCPKSQVLAITSMYRGSANLKIVEDQGTGLANAINQGFREINSKYWNWIGDDDKLLADGIEKIIEKLESDNDLSFGWGGCTYIDESSNILSMNKTGRIASKIIFFGPNLIPQPSCVFRFELTKEVGILNTRLKYAFDQDLIMRLLKIKKGIFLPVLSAEYRWHDNSLTAANKSDSARESLNVRLHSSKELGRSLYIVNYFTYPIVKMILSISRGHFRIRKFINHSIKFK